MAGIVGVEEVAEAHDDACRAHRISVSLQAGDAEGVCGVVVVVVGGGYCTVGWDAAAEGKTVVLAVEVVDRTDSG